MQQTATAETESDRPQRATPQMAAGGGYSLTFGVPSPDGRVLIGQDIEIFPDKPLPELTSWGAQAFEAVDKSQQQQGKQMALLCGRSLSPRVTNIASYKAIKNPHMTRLIEAGIVHWPPEGRQMFALVFDKPSGKRLMDTLESKAFQIAEDRIIPALIQPIMSVLADFQSVDLVHGGITPDNIYMTGTAGAEIAVLGECLSSAPFFRQHALFETVERGMAQPAGRGPGTLKNDLYALGICVALAVRGDNPMQGKEPDQIVREKIEHGTYASIVSRDRLPGGLSEFLRGVLNDDENQRWTVDETMRWLEGRHPGNKPAPLTFKATRPFIFGEEKLWDIRSLAMSFAAKPMEAAAIIDKDQFRLWMKRNFDDKDLQGRLEKVLMKEEGGSIERRIAHLCLALDPQAPVRYKRLSLFPDGFGAALAEVMGKEGEVQAYAEVIAQQFFSTWVQQRFAQVNDATNIISNFEKCRNFLTQKMPVYGIERILYQLNNEVVCMSPVLKKYVVLGPGHLLLALDAIARQATRPDTLLDRHMMAFISVREPKMIDPHLGHIISRDRGYQLLGMVRTLAAIQRRFQIDAVPALGNWIISMIGPAIEKFHDRDLRQEISKHVNKLTDSGNLIAILEFIDTPALVQDDEQRYAFARQEFAMLSKEGQQIVSHLKKRKFLGIESGLNVAMTISSVFAFCCVAGVILFHFYGGG